MKKSTRKPLYVANWKMHKTISETKTYFDKFLSLTAHQAEHPSSQSYEIVICPPFTALEMASTLSKETSIQLGAQNLFWEDSGAYTGEVSPGMLKEFGCNYVLIAHSERRKYFCETNQTANHKIVAALKHGIKPIYCIGETLEQMQQGETQKILENQLNEGLKNLDLQGWNNITIAYEPVWAIGTGKADSPSQTNQTAQFIRNCLKALAKENNSNPVRILYGGSVKPENVESFLSQTEIDGALVGGASLDPDAFSKIIRVEKSSLT